METVQESSVSAPPLPPGARLLRRLSEPVSAPVLDLFRILTGLLTVAYFVRLFREYPLYTSEQGLLDHRLLRELFWFTKLSLLFPGSPDLYKIAVMLVGLGGALMLLAGERPKLGAVLAWVVVVSVQRWNFAVINVDDSSITLLLWWMLFLPIGHTLTWRSWLDRSRLRGELAYQVDGFFLRALFGNLFIYYLTAGLTKLASELWREGVALYVVLNLPLARTHGMWTPEDLPFLWFGNEFTLVMEPLFPFILLLPKNHPLKWLGGISWVVFHLAIPVTIGVPYANLTLILCLVPVFHQELGGWFARRASGSKQVLDWTAPKGTRSLITAYLLILFLAMQKNVPVLDKVWEPAMATLYLGGVAQEYHLFDWIDRFNWTVSHTVTVTPEGGEPVQIPSEKLFPKTVRGFIMQSYLLPMRWMRVPRPLTGEWRNSVLQRAAARLVKTQNSTLGSRGTVEVKSKVGRLDMADLAGEDLWDTTLTKFRYDNGQVSFLIPQMPTESNP